MSSPDRMTVTAKVQQVGEYGIARPDEPIEVDRDLGKKLVKRGNFVEGLTPRAKARHAEALAGAGSKADADAAAKAKADSDAAARDDAEAQAKADEQAKAEAGTKAQTDDQSKAKG